MPARLRRILKLAFACLRDADMLNRLSALRRVGGEIVAKPPRNDPRREDRVVGPGKKMVGPVERNETFRMLRRKEDVVGVFDSDGLVQG